MQDYGSGKLVFSASGLAVASECQLAHVRRVDKDLSHSVEVPKANDPMLVRAGELGGVHEQKQLEAYRAQFPGAVVEIERPDYQDRSTKPSHFVWKSFSLKMRGLTTWTSVLVQMSNK